MAAGLTVVVDYGLCNIDSMLRALEECGARDLERASDPRSIEKASRIVLPGVGSFAAGMRNLNHLGLTEVIRHRSADRSVPFLGACLGMQLMAGSGTEGVDESGTNGLGLVPGAVVRLERKSDSERIPHIGWNEVAHTDGCALFRDIPQGSDFYFVHSYRVDLQDPRHEAGRTDYCGGFTSAIALHDRPIFGTQFHPEKSQKHGFQLLRNFLAL
jgi:glutamine amidotransferase